MKAAIAVLFAANLLAGCVGNNTQSLVIEQNNVPETSGGGCIAPGSTSSTFRQSGILDLTLLGGSDAYGYLMFPVVTNNLSSNVSGTSVSIDESALSIQLKRVEVEVSDENGALLMPKFKVTVFKLLGAGDSAGLIVDVLPGEARQYLSGLDLVLAKLTVIGERDGSDIRSNTMEYAIEICSGCLVVDQGACATFSGEGSANACNIAQDEPAVCCEDASGALLCPAVGEATSG